jgi:hypothetical protein
MRSIARTLIGVVVAVPFVILLVPVFAVAAALLLIASCARGIGHLLEPSFLPWTELIQFDRRLGWRPRSNLDARYLAEHDDVFRIVTDADGWPGHRSVDDSDIVVVGDSFAFGYGVDSGRTFTEVDNALRVKAVGALGYSMVHGVLLMEQLGLRLKGKLVVWFAYLENDLQDNLSPEMRGYRAPFVRLQPRGDRWEIVTDHLNESKWQCSYLDGRRLFPRLCVPGPLADRAYAACDFLIQRADSACTAGGGHLVVVSIPHPMQLTRDGVVRLAALSGRPELCDATMPDRRIANCCAKHGVPMVAATQYLCRRDYKRREGIHWNERGHRRMARMLGQLYSSFRSGALEAYVPGAGRRDEDSGSRRQRRRSEAVVSAAAERLGAGR